ncbi:MAG: response regulator, partial [Candidatus Competibacteraceae bacterium]|nr:response regulator [Candidatus Competibacteraceae bacterium]
TSHSADLPVIMITSRTMQKHRQQAAEAGANGYVTKPFDEDELLASIRSFVQ